MHLREATRAAHARLDAAYSSLDLGLRTDYALFLQATAAAVCALELLLEASGIESLLPDWSHRKRREALVDDLQQLDVDWEPLHVHGRPLNIGEQMGVAYVLEGSRLGSEILLERAHASADPAVGAATNYLSHGSDRRLWPSFLAALESAPLTSSLQHSVDAALETFATFRRALWFAIARAASRGGMR